MNKQPKMKYNFNLHEPRFKEDDSYKRRLYLAYLEWRNRHLRITHPHGVTESIGGKWFPYPHECRPCCERASYPGPKFTWTLKDHCRTYGHIARLYNVRPKHLKSLHYYVKRALHNNGIKNNNNKGTLPSAQNELSKLDTFLLQAALAMPIVKHKNPKPESKEAEWNFETKEIIGF